MNRITVALILSAAYVALGGFYLARVNSHIEAQLFLLPPLIAAIAGIYAAKTYGLKNIHGQVMSWLAAGLAFFFVGELIFYLYQFELDRMPFPSIADAFYLLAYPLLLVGLMIEVKQHRPKLSEFSKTTLALMTAILVILIAVVSYFGIYLVYDQESSTLSNTIAMAYGVADLIILIPTMYVLKLAFGFRGGKLFNSWMMIFFAMLFMLAGDILFALNSEKYSNGVWPYNLIDLTWTASYLLFAYSFYYTASVLKELRGRLNSDQKKS